MKDNSQIKAIIFDIDGTLYSNSFMLLSAPFLYIKNVLWILRFSRMRRRLRAHLKRTPSQEVSADSKRSFDAMSVQMFAEELRMPQAQAQVLLRKHIYNAWIYAISKTPLRYGMRFLIGDLHRRGFKLGVLTDFQSTEKLAYWQITKYFDAVICAEDYGVLKPDIRIFEKTCEDLECTPSEVLFVGNHVKYDGIGAACAGMRPLIFSRKRVSPHKLAQYNMTVFSDMRGLHKALSVLL